MRTSTRKSQKDLAEAVTPKTRADFASISSETRQYMIAEAAYFLAERRGFEPGYATQDWLAAEELIRRQLSVS